MVRINCNDDMDLIANEIRLAEIGDLANPFVIFMITGTTFIGSMANGSNSDLATLKVKALNI